MLSDSNQLFASRYKLSLPREKELSEEIEQENEIVRRQDTNRSRRPAPSRSKLKCWVSSICFPVTTHTGPIPANALPGRSGPSRQRSGPATGHQPREDYTRISWNRHAPSGTTIPDLAPFSSSPVSVIVIPVIAGSVRDLL